jgi:diguanylate cyclase (GGDEF)-like protein/PAS domain S-box-containing protein
MTEGATIEDQLQFLYLMQVAVVKFRADGTVDLINPMAARLLMPLAARRGNLDDLYAALEPLVPDLRQRVALFADDAGTIIDLQRLEANVDGSTAVLSLMVNKIKHDTYMAVLKDVTKLAEQERKLFTDHQKFRAIFDHVRDYAIYTITSDGVVDEWNQSLERYAGWLQSDVQGRGMSMFFPPDDPDQPPLGTLLSEARRIGSVETEGWRLKRDGTGLWGNTVITALPDESGAVRGFVVVARDMTERKRIEDELRLFATVDPLTDAYNRRYGQDRLLAAWNSYARDGQSFAVLMLDIDRFKSINDQSGHPAGDAVLCALVRTCKNLLRSIDTVARWGGEEFLLILANADAASAMLVAERLRATIANLRVEAPGGALLQSSRFCVLHRQKIQKTQCVIDYDVGSKWEFAADPNSMLTTPLKEASGKTAWFLMKTSMPSALTGTDPLSLTKADPADARLLVIERGGATISSRSWRSPRPAADRLPWPVSLFGERAVSSPRPTFHTATRAAAVRGGAEQPGATRSAL